MEQKIRVCYICNEYPPLPHGGIGTFVKDIAEGLVKAGHEVLVVSVCSSGSERTENGVRVVELRSSKVPHKFRGWFDRYKLFKYIKSQVRSGAIDIIDVPDFQGWLPFKFNFCPVVVRLHLSELVICDHKGCKVSSQIGYFEKQTLTVHNNWVGVSRWAYDQTAKVLGRAPGFSEVIYYPVSLQGAVDYKLPAEKYILYAGTVSERKGALTLARAAAAILKKYPDYHLVYAGAPISDTIFTDISKILGEDLKARLHFTGRVSRGQMAALMTKAGVFAFPSKLETFGLVIAEAMLSDTPVVCCNIGPCPEFVKEGETGLLVPADDDSSLIEAIDKLISNSDFAEKISKAGHDYISNGFTIDKAVKNNICLYEKLLSAGQINQ